MKTILLSGLEESKLKLDDQQVDELMEIFFEEIESEKVGLIGLDEFKSFLSKYPGVAENLSVRYLGHMSRFSQRYRADPVHLVCIV